MNLHEKRLATYCEAHTTDLGQTLYELERETHLKTLAPQMISGPVQGQLMSMLSKMIKPNRILEIGSFTGYGALCLAQGLNEDGKLFALEANRELEYIIQKYIAAAKLEKQIELHIGNAFDLIPTFAEKWDLVFIDAGKKDYAAYYDLVFEQLNVGGFILADNVLWSGKVVSDHHSADSKVLHEFNTKVQADDRVENVLLPIRDGLSIIRKIKD